jgi:hypothetical protein
MCAKSVSDPLVPGVRCPHRVRQGLPCPGRMLPVRDAWPIAVTAPRLRCNGPDAHEVEVAAPVKEPRRTDGARTRVA